MSTLDQKRAFNKLKHELEPWREIIVKVDGLLTWEKNYYPAVVCALVTAYFMALWLLDFSTITLLALIAMFAVIFNAGYPTLARLVFAADNWSGVDEERFENACSQLSQVISIYKNCHDYLFNSKERKSTIFVLVSVCALIVMAWLGSVMNNFLLMYFFVLTVALYPGIQKRCLFGAVKEQLGSVVNEKMKLLREKKSE